MATATTWEPPSTLAREQILAASDEVLGRPDLPLTEREDLIRLDVLGLKFDVGGKVYQPADESRIPRGADGKRVGAFLLHGGAGDHRNMEPLARLLAGKLGYRVATMTFPGNLYLLDPSHAWPGDTIEPDGRVRVPMFCKDEPITPDQYDLVQDHSDPVIWAKYGTFHFLEAKEGTPFYDWLAALPVAFDEGMREICRRNFPADDFSVYGHGHSTGGPFVHLMLQRVPNVAGLIGMESSPFGAIFSKMQGHGWPYPFNRVVLRTWRDVARYAGPQAGPEGMWRLPQLMEEVLAQWDASKSRPNLKAEYPIHLASFDALEAAARATARRLKLDDAETEALVRRYRAYPVPLEGPDVKPVPPLLYGITKGSRDHRPERYHGILLPALAALNPAPKARVVEFGTGVHSYLKPEEGLPSGIGPAIAGLWDDAIREGYYLA